MPQDRPSSATAYEILRVHPFAPSDLISASYWELTRELRERDDEESIDRLRELTQAYGRVSDSEKRERYNAEIGLTLTPVTDRPSPRKRPLLSRLIWRRRTSWSAEPHEILGLHPEAPQACVPEAYRQMRNAYLRLPRGRKRTMLLRALEDAYLIVGDPDSRRELLDHRSARAHSSGMPPDTELSSEQSKDDGFVPEVPANAGDDAARRDGEPGSRQERPGIRERLGPHMLRVLRLLGSLAGLTWRSVQALGRLSWRLLVATGSRIAAGWRDLQSRRSQRAEAESANVASPDDVFLGRLASSVERDQNRLGGKAERKRLREGSHLDVSE